MPITSPPAVYSDQWIDQLLQGYPPLLTRTEYATLVRVHPRTVTREIAAGRLSAIRTCETGSGRVLIAREVAAQHIRRMAGRA